MSIKITGVGIGLPERIVTNEEFAKMVETSDEWIITRTGIKERRIATTESMLDLAVTASQEALDGVKDIDLIICATLQGDCVTPSLSSMIQNRLGLSCPAFDVNAACSGFIYTLEIAKNFILSGTYKKILIVCAEMMSKHFDWTHRATCVLFGDAAAACVVEAGKGLEYINLTTVGDDRYIRHDTRRGNNPFAERKVMPFGDEAPPPKGNYFLQFNGQEVYKFALGAAQRELEKCLKTLDLDAEKIDNFILHQANKRIIDSVRKNLNLPEDKFPTNVAKYGNTSAVSILLLLYELLKAGKIKKGDKLFMTAFGGGLTSACCLMNWGV